VIGSRRTLSKFPGFSEGRLRLGRHPLDVDTVIRDTQVAGVRDAAVQKLRDVTVAIAVAAAAGVAAIAWVSAATIPGSAGTSGLSGDAAAQTDDQPITAPGDDFNQTTPAQTRFGPGVAVSGGSR
jgi:hypothetical protein